MRNSVAKKLRILAALTGQHDKALKRRWNALPRRGPGLLSRRVAIVDRMIAMLRAKKFAQDAPVHPMTPGEPAPPARA